MMQFTPNTVSRLRREAKALGLFLPLSETTAALDQPGTCTATPWQTADPYRWTLCEMRQWVRLPLKPSADMPAVQRAAAACFGLSRWPFAAACPQCGRSHDRRKLCVLCCAVTHCDPQDCP